MSVQAYLLLKGDGSADIKSAIDVQKREGSEERLCTIAMK